VILLTVSPDHKTKMSSSLVPFLGHSSRALQSLTSTGANGDVLDAERQGAVAEDANSFVEWQLSWKQLQAALLTRQELPENSTSKTPLFHEVCGVRVPAFRQNRGKPSATPSFLPPSSAENLRRLATAVALGSEFPGRSPAILVEGPPGSGKTWAIRTLASLCGHHGEGQDGDSLIELHLDDVTDGKMLLGSFVCTETPGEFAWRPGPVTEAALKGSWLLVEDADRAPFEVFSSLQSLLRYRVICIPGRPLLKAHPDFRLFFTRSVGVSAAQANATFSAGPLPVTPPEVAGGAGAGSDDDVSSLAAQIQEHLNKEALAFSAVASPCNGPIAAFSHYCIRVPILPLRRAPLASASATFHSQQVIEDEVAMVLSRRHPSIPKPVLDLLLTLFAALSTLHGGGNAAAASADDTAHQLILSYLPSSARNLARYGRGLSPIDLFRLAARIDALIGSRFGAAVSPASASGGGVGGATSNNSQQLFHLTDNDKEVIADEALSVLAGHVSDSEVRKGLMKFFSALLGLGEDTADLLMRLRKPDFSVASSSSTSSSSSSSSVSVRVGRVVLPSFSNLSSALTTQQKAQQQQQLPPSFAPTRHGLRVLERVAVCVAMKEPCLLVGETGIGKTSAIQALAEVCNVKMTAINLNMQTDSSDLLGGFQPVHLKQLAIPLYNDFQRLFSATFSESANAGFLTAVQSALSSSHWAKYSRGMNKGISSALAKLKVSEGVAAAPTTAANASLALQWSQLSVSLAAFERQRSALEGEANGGKTSGGGKQASSSSMAFSFVEGALVNALRKGDWVLLDEINLASGETLQRLSGLLQGSDSKLTITERGGVDIVTPHPNFRLFAAMNPSTGVGKRDLPPALRNRFSEIYVDDVTDPDDLALIVQRRLQHVDLAADALLYGPNNAVSGGGMVAGDASSVIRSVVQLYLPARSMAKAGPGSSSTSSGAAGAATGAVALRDGAGGLPHYSVRTLTRALRFACDMASEGYSLRFALREGIIMAFMVQLDAPSFNAMFKLLDSYFPLPQQASDMQKRAGAGSTEVTTAAAAGSAATAAAGKKRKAAGGTDASSSTSASTDLSTADAVRSNAARVMNAIKGPIKDTASHILVGTAWVKKGPLQPVDLALTEQPSSTSGSSASSSTPRLARYVLVPSVQRCISTLARAVANGKAPVLLQGPTSAGKTSMVQYLASLTGNPCVRINNHEHTDLAEYLGTYITDPKTGNLSFCEGLLVLALRQGYWIILDELNLAPSEVLEALNRLLDDNRELFIPETQQFIKPHPDFMLFATQNPAGLYGGRKQLSQAFRNRFIEVHVDDIPEQEMATILSKRSLLPASFVSAMVGVAGELQRLRQSSDVFAGKHGFVTTRDLLRWANRKPDTYESLAHEGWMLLGERLRSNAEKQLVAGVIAKHCKTPQLLADVERLFVREMDTNAVATTPAAQEVRPRRR
jgi:midasin (ATPase involved in ribosome maturation)